MKTHRDAPIQFSESLYVKDYFLRVGQQAPEELLEYETGALPPTPLLILGTRILVVGEICNTPRSSTVITTVISPFMVINVANQAMITLIIALSNFNPDKTFKSMWIVNL